MVIVDKRFVYDKETHTTVMKTSLFFAGDGFAAYDCNGKLVFRVESYGADTRDTREVVLMDSKGRCLLTVRSKWPSLHQRWEGFIGERKEGVKPIFSVRRVSMIGRSSLTVELFGKQREEYHIDGQFAQRNCTIYNSANETMAEIRRKVDVSTNVMLAKDVLLLTLKPGFDRALAMGLVLAVDQIIGDDEDDGSIDLGPTVQNCILSS